MGNEEMVPFAYKVYQDYEMNHEKLGEDGRPMDMALYIRNFREAFCRHEHDEQGGHDDESGTKVHFLGLFDTVSSVSTFDVPLTKTAVLPSLSGTAKIVRHAVAIDERRVKFKAALLAQDPDLAQYMHKAKDEDTIPAQHTHKAKGEEDIKEVWFPGNHGDVGGGWPAVPPSLDANSVPQLDHKPTDKKNDAFQLSDIALKWMINELEELDDQLKWGTSKDDYLKRFEDHREKAISSQIHDTLSFGGGTSWLKVLFWNFLGERLALQPCGRTWLHLLAVIELADHALPCLLNRILPLHQAVGTGRGQMDTCLVSAEQGRYTRPSFQCNIPYLGVGTDGA